MISGLIMLGIEIVLVSFVIRFEIFCDFWMGGGYEEVFNGCR